MIFSIPAFKDNYIWLLQDKQNQSACVIDPGDAAPVISFLEKNGLTLTDILITHHHADHSGGIGDLLAYQPHLKIYGSHQSPVDAISHRVREGDRVLLSSLCLNVLEIPGHTLDHVAFYNDDFLFCGDTLFSAGCGRVFEGTYPQMYESLNKLRCLPDQTKVCCGHEYTRQNLLFAQKVEPDNRIILEKMREIEGKECTLPSLLGQEKLINPFLRCEEVSVIQSAERYQGKILSTPQEVFQCLREWKNQF